MSGKDGKPPKDELVFEFELEAPPEKVWRAVRLAEFRERWLPDDALAHSEPVSSVPGREVSYRMRDDAPPFFESIVTFHIGPRVENGTLLKIVHRLTDVRARSHPGQAANSNGPCLMRAA